MRVRTDRRDMALHAQDYVCFCLSSLFGVYPYALDMLNGLEALQLFVQQKVMFCDEICVILVHYVVFVSLLYVASLSCILIGNVPRILLLCIVVRRSVSLSSVESWVVLLIFVRLRLHSHTLTYIEAAVHELSSLVPAFNIWPHLKSHSCAQNEQIHPRFYHRRGHRPSDYTAVES